MSLKIGAILEEPFSTVCAFDSNCANRGYGVEVTNLICSFLKLNCTYSWFNSTAYGDVDENNTATGLVAAIYNGTFDTAIPILTQTSRRSQVLEFSELYFYTDVLLVTRSPEMKKIDNLNQSMPWLAWFGFLLIITACSIILSVTMKQINPPYYIKRESYFCIIISNLRDLITGEFDRFKTGFWSSRMLLTFWFAVYVVLTSAYTCLLYSKEVMQRTETPFEDFLSFVDCLTEDKCRVITPTLSYSTIQLIQYPGAIQSQRITDAFNKNPIEVLEREKIPDRILMEKNIFLVWPALKGVFYRVTGNNKGCQFYTVPAPFKDLGAFAVRKENKSLLAKFNRMAEMLRESGLADHIESLSSMNNGVLPECKQQTLTVNKTEHINLRSMENIFIFYFTGVAIGLGAFAVEKLVQRHYYYYNSDLVIDIE